MSPMQEVNPAAVLAEIPGVDLAGCRSIPEMQARLIEIGRKRRADRIAAYGYAPGCECSGCGDSGWYGGMHEHPCHCPAGQAIEDRRSLELGWKRRIPAGYQRYRFAGCLSQGGAFKARAYVDLGRWRRGENLILTGVAGTGKTGLAVAAAHELHFTHRQSIAFAFVPGLVRGLMPTLDEGTRAEGEAMFRLAKRLDVTVLDDLGAEQATDYAERVVLEVLDERRQRRLPTILTSNVDPAAMPEALGPRLARRVLAGGTYVEVAA